MKVWRCVSGVVGVLVLGLSSHVAWGQASVYGSVAVTNFCLTTDSNTSCKRDTGGFLGGVFYNFPLERRLTLGIDGRGSYGVGSRGGMSATAAFRLGFVPTHVRLRPYVQLGSGVVSSAGGDVLGTRHTSYAGHFAVGLDVRLTDSVDLRALEIGGAAAGGTNSNPGAGTSYIDAGLVYHFAKRKS